MWTMDTSKKDDLLYSHLLQLKPGAEVVGHSLGQRAEVAVIEAEPVN